MSYRKLAFIGLLVVIILCGIIPSPVLARTPDLEYSLSPSIGGGDTIRYTPDNVTSPVTGVVKVIVIAVESDDKIFNSTISDLNTIFFHRLSDYITSISYGKLRIDGTVAGPFHAPKLMSSYGADIGLIDGDPGIGVRTYQLVQDAVQVADPSVDFSSYQYLVIVHSGDGEECNPKITENIWSVAYLGGVSFTTSEKSFDRAAIVPEREGKGADVLGAYAHEFLHLLGLPDLYSTSEGGGGEAGKWDVMARGLWNGNPPGSDPAHPTAWSKAMLGWIGPEQIAEVAPNESLTAYVDSIERPSLNLKALRIPLSESSYYMVEYRSRALDSGLPDEGALITLVNLKRAGSSGAITIIGTHGDINRAPLKLGESYANKDENLLVSTRFSNSTDYGIDVIRGHYRAIEVNLPGFNTIVLVDGKPCTPTGNGRTVVFVTPGSHLVVVPQIVIINPEQRSLFKSWSDGDYDSERIVQAIENVSLSTSYREQVLLSIQSNGISTDSDPSTLEINGIPSPLNDLTPVDTWIDLNQIANVTMITHVVRVDDSTQYVFKGWEGDNSNSTLDLQMSQPLKLVAQFEKQFYLKIKSEFGNPEGEGWYDNGSMAAFNVSSPHYTNTTERYLFESWSGLESKQPVASVVMDRPYVVTAQWDRQFLVNIAVLGSDGRRVQGDELKVLLEAPNGTKIAQPLENFVWLDDGVWFVRTVQWMNVDVSPLERTYRPTGGGTWIIRPNVHSLAVSVTSRIFRMSISDVVTTLELPNGELYVGHTDGTGRITINNLPPYEYSIRLTKGGRTLSIARVYIVQDTKLDVKASDPFENTVVAGFISAGIVSLTLVALPTALSRRKRKRTRIDSTTLDDRVYEYIVSNAGVISRAKAARDLAITPKALMDAISHLSATHPSDRHSPQSS